MTYASSSVRPRIYASGAISIVPFSINFSVCSFPNMLCNASYRGVKYGSTFSFKSPGRNPKLSPASTAGRVRTIRFTSPFFKALTALVTAKNVLPVPAGPIANTTAALSIALAKAYCPNVFGTITFPLIVLPMISELICEKSIVCSFASKRLA